MNKIEQAQIDAYNNPDDDTAFGIGPMEDALIRFRQEVAKQLTRTNKERVLDIGCGRGEVVEALADNMCAVGIDLAPDRVTDTAQIINKGLFVTARGQELPFSEGSISGVTCFEVYEHLIPEDGRNMLKEIMRVLESDALVVISTPNTLSIGGRIRSLFGKKGSGRDDHFNEVNYIELRNFLEQAGFTNIELQGIGLFPGMWKMQKLFPFAFLQDLNIRLARYFPQIASETLAIAQKPVLTDVV